MKHAELEVDVIRSGAAKVVGVIATLAAVCAITATIFLIKFGSESRRATDWATSLYVAAAALGGVAYWQYQRQKRRLSLFRADGVHTLEVRGVIEEEGPFEVRFGYDEYRPAGRKGASVRGLVLCIDKDERTVCTLEENENPDRAAPRGWPEGWPNPQGGPRFEVTGGRPTVVELQRRLDAGAIDGDDAIDDDVISEGDVAALVKMFGGSD